MFDIAAVQKVFGDDYVLNALSAFPKEEGLAKNVAEKMSHALAQGVLSGLTVREDFSDLTKTAQTSAIELFSKITR